MTDLWLGFKGYFHYSVTRHNKLYIRRIVSTRIFLRHLIPAIRCKDIRKQQIQLQNTKLCYCRWMRLVVNEIFILIYLRLITLMPRNCYAINGFTTFHNKVLILSKRITSWYELITSLLQTPDYLLLKKFEALKKIQWLI